RFFGRSAELARIRAALPDRRLVTIVGPGGVGKTRLALELLRAGTDHPVGPAYLVELAEIPISADLTGAVAAALSLRTAPAGVLAAIADQLADEPALLVLDNCEHLLAPAAGLVSDLLRRCPRLRVLATSRRRLNLPGEQVIRLGPLTEAEQVELFCDRAALLRSDFEPSAPTLELAGQVCRLLDGLPLAVEPAASREAVFGLAQLRQHLRAGLQVLDPPRGGNRSTAVTATVEWSYRLLDPDARTLLDRLAVCRGGFGPDALDRLAPPGAGHPAGLLAELVDASLVICDLSEEPPRYRLLETVRHVGMSHLSAYQRFEAHLAHAWWMRAHAEHMHAHQRERSPLATAMLRREAANLSLALSWLIDQGRWGEAAGLGVLVAFAVIDDPDLSLIEQLRRLGPEPGSATGPDSADRSDDLRCLAAGVAAFLAGDAAGAEHLFSTALTGLPADHPQRWIGYAGRLYNRMFGGEVANVAADARMLRADRSAPEWVAANGICCAALMHLFAGHRALAHAVVTGEDDLLRRMADRNGFIAYTRGELCAADDPHRALAWFEQAYAQAARLGHNYDREVAGVARAAVFDQAWPAGRGGTRLPDLDRRVTPARHGGAVVHGAAAHRRTARQRRRVPHRRRAAHRHRAGSGGASRVRAGPGPAGQGVAGHHRQPRRRRAGQCPRGRPHRRAGRRGGPGHPRAAAARLSAGAAAHGAGKSPATAGQVSADSLVP
ncbi:MAG TPA: hypothetical protein VF163_01050, partial [Micromonosporaceae bacterium]